MGGERGREGGDGGRGGEIERGRYKKCPSGRQLIFTHFLLEINLILYTRYLLCNVQVVYLHPLRVSVTLLMLVTVAIPCQLNETWNTDMLKKKQVHSLQD